MSYDKPEVILLGKALRIIDANKVSPGVEADQSGTHPAYELDE